MPTPDPTQLIQVLVSQHGLDQAGAQLLLQFLMQAGAPPDQTAAPAVRMPPQQQPGAPTRPAVPMGGPKPPMGG